MLNNYACQKYSTTCEFEKTIRKSLEYIDTQKDTLIIASQNMLHDLQWVVGDGDSIKQNVEILIHQQQVTFG